MIGIIHPDLGIGGAERLVVDFALRFVQSQKQISLYTAHHEKTHCFKETLENDKRVEWVQVRGDFLPTSLNGYFHVLCANLRCAWAALCLLLEADGLNVVIIDQVFLPVLLFRLFSRVRVIFYCHFPDKMLAKRKSLLRRVYRLPIDAMEGFAMSLAHKVVVNSQFTASAYKETFRKWSSRSPAILYPSVRSCNIFKDNILDSLGVLSCSKTFFLSINRFERKKRLHIAILAFHILRKRLDARSGEKPFLILGGGYDERIRENVEHIIELKRLVKKISVGNHVLFLPSLSEKTKECLLQNSIALLYTPINEHFGITPLESMAAGRPVISCNSGGPCETVIDGGSGLLVSGTPEDFAEAMFSLYMETERADRLGEYAKRHIQNVFSAYQFGKKIDEILL